MIIQFDEELKFLLTVVGYGCLTINVNKGRAQKPTATHLRG